MVRQDSRPKQSPAMVFLRCTTDFSSTFFSCPLELLFYPHSPVGRRCRLSPVSQVPSPPLMLTFSSLTDFAIAEQSHRCFLERRLFIFGALKICLTDAFYLISCVYLSLLIFPLPQSSLPSPNSLGFPAGFRPESSTHALDVLGNSHDFGADSDLLFFPLLRRHSRFRWAYDDLQFPPLLSPSSPVDLCPHSVDFLAVVCRIS